MKERREGIYQEGREGMVIMMRGKNKNKFEGATEVVAAMV